MNVEGFTDKDGNFKYLLDGPGQYILTVSRDGYVSYVKEMCLSKQSVYDISVPAIPIVEDNDDKAVIQIVLSGDCGSAGNSFYVYCPISIS